MQVLLSRNLYTLYRGKISPAGRNDTFLIKPGIFPVIALIENLATHVTLYVFNKVNFR